MERQSAYYNTQMLSETRSCLKAGNVFHKTMVIRSQNNGNQIAKQQESDHKTMGIRSQNNGNQITKQWESDHKTMGIRLQCLNAKNLRTMLIYGAQVGQQGGLEDSRL